MFSVCLSEISCFMCFLLNEAPRLPRSIIAQFQLYRVPVSSITHKPTPQWRESRRAGNSCIYTRLREMNCRRWSWPLYWAMSAGSRSFSTEHFRPLALLGEEEIRGEASHIPLPSLSSSFFLSLSLMSQQTSEEESWESEKLHCLWRSQLILSGWSQRKSFGCFLKFTIHCYYYSVSVCLLKCITSWALHLNSDKADSVLWVREL